MSDLPDCRQSANLESLLLGRLRGEEAMQLEDHVSGCPVCAERLKHISAEDNLVRAVRSVRAPKVVPFPQLMERMLPGLRLLASPETPTESWNQTVMSPSAPLTAIPATSLPFLDPAREAGELGRLGPYRVLEILGSGGMGMVFRGEDPRLQRAVALKIIRPEVIDRPHIRERFFREARAVAAIEHENIVAVYEVEENQGFPFLAMPLLRGQSLAEFLQKTPEPLSIDEILRIGREIAAGLSAAHEAGLIHRDIKPGNLWRDDTGRIRILDFGLVQSIRSEDVGPLTLEGSLLGTPGYMSPEQARGQPVDPRADLFSLGCVIYEIATGKRPFTGTDVMAVIISIATDEPKAPREIRPEIPVEVEQLIQQLLAKNREDRPATAQEVVERIQAIETQRSTLPRSWISRRGWLVATSGGLLGGVGLWGIFGNGSREAPPPIPGTATFDFDEPDVGLILSRDGVETIVDPQTKKLSLPPGDYQLRTTKEIPGRQLLPNNVTIESGREQSFSPALVGEIRRISPHSQTIMALAVWSAGEKVLAISGSLDRSLVLWNPRSDAKPTVLDHGNPVRAVAIAKGGQEFASAGGEKRAETDLSIHRWSAAENKPVGKRLIGHQSLVTALAYSPDGKTLLSGSADGQLLLWNLSSGNSEPLEAHDGLGVAAIAFSPDGRRALTGGGDGKLLLWNMEKPTILRRFDAHAQGIRACLFLPGSLAMVSAGEDGEIQIRDAKSLEIRTLTGHDGPVLSLAASEDGQKLLSGGRDGKLRLWDTATGKVTFVQEGHRAGVTGLALIDGGKRAISAGADRIVKFWRLPS